MSTLRAWCFRIGGLFDKDRKDRELAEELDSHIHLHVADNIRAGMSPEEALRDALIKFGGVEQAKEKYRDRRGLPAVETVWQDIRFGARMLRKNLGFTFVSVLTLALGIGVSVAVYTVAAAVLIHPLPFADPSRLVMLWEGFQKAGFSKLGFSSPDLSFFENGQTSFQIVSAFQNEEIDLSGRGQPERVMTARISASLIPLLGKPPIIGRAFEPEEDAPGHNLAMLSYGLWQSHFGGDKAILGQQIELNRQVYTVIGVMARDFVFPLLGPAWNHQPADVWIPMAFTPAEKRGWGQMYNNDVVARLKPGVSIEESRKEASLISGRLVNAYPPAVLKAFNGASPEINVYPFQEEVTGRIRMPLLMLATAAESLLLIACANVAILLLSRAASRQREIATRSSLGATQGRLLRQLVTENLILATLGGGLGFILAVVCKRLLLRFTPEGVPLPKQIPISGDVVIFAVLLSLFTALFFSAVPAFRISAKRLQGWLQEGGRGATIGRAHHRLQGMFAAADFALALVMLVGAGLLARSFAKLVETNPGFRPDHVLTFSVSLPYNAYPQAAQVRGLYNNLLERLHEIPGTGAIGLSTNLPLETRDMEAFDAEHQGVIEPTNAIPATWTQGNYFQAEGILLLRGRWFDDDDQIGSQPVTIVSQTFAQRYWMHEDPIGKRIRFGGPKAPWQTIVGVVGNVNDRLLDRSLSDHVYMPYPQLPDKFIELKGAVLWRSMSVAIRTQGDPDLLSSIAVDQIHSLDPELPVAHVRTMVQVVSSSMSGPKFNTLLMGILALVALLLASIGIYGLMTYISQQRTNEIGIRMAFGAQRRDVLKAVVWEGARLALIGLTAGVAGALALTGFMSNLLYGVTPTDPFTFVSAILMLFCVALLACYVPARRATKVDPMVALRYE